MHTHTHTQRKKEREREREKHTDTQKHIQRNTPARTDIDTHTHTRTHTHIVCTKLIHTNIHVSAAGLEEQRAVLVWKSKELFWFDLHLDFTQTLNCCSTLTLTLSLGTDLGGFDLVAGAAAPAGEVRQRLALLPVHTRMHLAPPLLTHDRGCGRE